MRHLKSFSGHIIDIQPDSGRGTVITDIKNGEATTTEYILDPTAIVRVIDPSTKRVSTLSGSDFISAYPSMQKSLKNASFTLTVEGKTITALEEN